MITIIETMMHAEFCKLGCANVPKQVGKMKFCDVRILPECRAAMEAAEAERRALPCTGVSECDCNVCGEAACET